MRTLQLKSHLTNEQLIEKLSSCRNTPDFSRWQILYLIQVARQRSADIIIKIIRDDKFWICAVTSRMTNNKPLSIIS